MAVNKKIFIKKFKFTKTIFKKKNWVSFTEPGCLPLTIHKRYPTTAWHGSFDLLPFGSGPVPSSLDNLVASDSSKATHVDAKLGADVWST